MSSVLFFQGPSGQEEGAAGPQDAPPDYRSCQNQS